MNANKKMIAVSAMAAAVAAMVVAFPAAADDHRDARRGERPAVVARHAPPPHAASMRQDRFPQRAQPQRVVVERPVYQRRAQVVQRPVVVERPVYVRRTVVVERPAPVYYPAPRQVYGHNQAPVYYDQSASYHNDDSNPAGAIAGAVIGGVIGSQVGDGDSRGITTVIGAILGGLIGNGF